MLLGTVHADPLGVLIAFGAGILSFVSPCVLPLVPAYVGLVAGVRTGDLGDGAVRTGKVLRPTLFFVGGFTLVFVILGAGASSLGAILFDHRRGLEEISGVAVLTVGALLATGFSPAFLEVERRFHVEPAALGAWAPPVMGAAFAFGWTPCIGPVLGAVISMAAARGTMTGGIVLLTAYSLGLGVPFVLFGVAAGRLAGVVSWAKTHHRAIALVGGGVMVAWGALMVAGQVTVVSSWFTTLLQDLHLTRLTTS